MSWNRGMGGGHHAGFHVSPVARPKFLEAARKSGASFRYVGSGLWVLERATRDQINEFKSFMSAH